MTTCAGGGVGAAKFGVISAASEVLVVIADMLHTPDYMRLNCVFYVRTLAVTRIPRGSTTATSS